MTENNVLVVFLFLINILLCFGIGSSLHNIDLVYNAQKGLIDCNGLICENVEVIYQRSVMNLWIMFPIEITFAFSLGFLLRTQKH